MSEKDDKTNNKVADSTPNIYIGLKARYIGMLFSRKFLILIIATVILLLGHFTDLTTGFGSDVMYYIVIIAAVVSSRMIEAGNPQDDYEQIKTLGLKGYIKYKSKLIFGPDFATMLFLSGIFFFDVVSPGEYVTACSIYIGANSLNKVSDITAKIAGMPVLRRILGNNNDTGGENR